MRSDTQQTIIANLDKTDAQIVALVAQQPPVAKPSDTAVTYATFVSIGKLLGDNNAAGDIANKLQAWIDAEGLPAPYPNRGQLSILYSRLAGYPGLDFADAQVPSMLGLFVAGAGDAHPPILSADQANALLAIGYTLPEQVTEADVAAFRGEYTRGIEADALLVKAESYISCIRTEANAYKAGTTNTLPTVPEVPQA